MENYFTAKYDYYGIKLEEIRNFDGEVIYLVNGEEVNYFEFEYNSDGVAKLTIETKFENVEEEE